MRALVLLSLALAVAGCEVIEQPSGLIARWTTAYREVISENDRVRLLDWRATFISALGAARRSGHGAEIDREGALLNSDAAQAGPAIPDGTYQCRVIKLGSAVPGHLDFVEDPPSTCRVRPDHQVQRLGKFSGSQRYVGLIFPGDAIRSVFLGTLVLGDERRALQYGQDEQRDVAGYVERIGPDRWRLIMPQPHFESRFDVMELVAAGASPEKS